MTCKAMMSERSCWSHTVLPAPGTGQFRAVSRVCAWGGWETRPRAQGRALRYSSEKRGSTLLRNSTKPSREVLATVKSGLDTRVLTLPGCSRLRSPGPSCSAHVGAGATATLCVHTWPSSRGAERTEGLSADPAPALRPPGTRPQVDAGAGPAPPPPPPGCRGRGRAKGEATAGVGRWP